MVVTHDLYADLNLSAEEVAKRSQSDTTLQQLLSDYDKADSDVVEAEESSLAGAGDDELKTLKEKRLLVKDKIVQRLTYLS